MKRTSVILTDEDLAALEVVKRRYGQEHDASVLRLCVRMVAQAKEIVLESPSPAPPPTAEEPPPATTRRRQHGHQMTKRS